MDKIVDTRLATTLGENGATISTTEHLLAAVNGCGIDNAVIEIDSLEVPIMDGSAAPFVSLLKTAGKKRQNAFRKVLKITDTITYRDGDKTMTISPFDGFRVTGEIVFDDKLISSQQLTVDVTTEHFISEISRARTFGYVEQVEELWANGLAMGGTLENVIAIHWNRSSVLNEDGLRFQDEFIRHKILDLIGDITLLGCPVLGHIQAFKPGHTQHAAFMHAIAASPQCWELIELKQNGSYAVLNNVFSNTRAAGEKLMFPFLPQAPAAAIAP